MIDDNDDIDGDMEAFFEEYESGAMAIGYTLALLKQQKEFELMMDRVDSQLVMDAGDD